MITPDVPSGTVTFLFTDIEGSTKLWESAPTEMAQALGRHDSILRSAIGAAGGYVFATGGDGFAAAFARVGDALRSARDAQVRLAAENWPQAVELRVRMGLHTGESEERDGDYFGPVVNRAARLMAIAHGGQILVSDATEAVVRDEFTAGAVLRDLGEHRMRDLGSPVRVFQLVSSGLTEVFPPLRSLESFPGNLPGQGSSFVGRRNDLARAVSALGASRVVTITGVGGVGKTRLALQVAADGLPGYRDGAWFVDLAPVRDPAGVLDAVADAVRLTARSGRSIDDSLVETLVSKKLLLFLDNCEHQLEPVAALVSRIERDCPGVTVLCTSREGLAIDGERLIALPPLAAGRSDDDAEQLLSADAVCLFAERARQVKADFVLSESNVWAVSEVCRRLDGVPLAIELAAARVIALSPAELVDRLDRRFQVLAGGRRGAVDRHATLRAAIDWSYELLSAAEKQLFERLAVFPGGCTLEAAEMICTDDPAGRDAVLDLITSLVARSLLVADDSRVGTRYRLLETIRQYSEEKLAERGETEMIRRRHAHYYADLVARASEKYYGPEQLEWARRVGAETDNIRGALVTAVDAGDTATAVRLVANQQQEYQAESPTGAVILIPASVVLDLPGVAQEPGYPLLLVVAAYGAQSVGDWSVVEDLCRQALEADRALIGSPHGSRVEMYTSGLRAQTALAGGSYAAAAAAYAHAAELARHTGYLGQAAKFLAYAVNCALLGGNAGDEVKRTAEDAVVLARQSGMPGAVVLAINSLAMSLAEDEPARCRDLLEENIVLCDSPGEEIPSGLLTASLVAGRLRNWDLALRLSVRTLLLWRLSSSVLQSAPCLALCARALAESRPEAAGVLRGAAYRGFRRVSPTDSASDQQRMRSPNANFVLEALRECGSLVAAALGEERQRELRGIGEAMTEDQAISYVLTTVDQEHSSGRSG